MTKEAMERGLVVASWMLDGGFLRHLVIGEDHDLSRLVPPWVWEARDLTFEVCDGERTLTY